MGSGRIHHIDFLRCASVLYIVGFWHMMEYWPASVGYHNWLTSRITAIVLGVFVFLSGYLLALKPVRWRAAEVRGFYVRRFLRIYPLYLGALLVFGVLGLADWRSVFLSALLASPFLGHVPLTLWFVAVLLVFYLVAPVLIAARTQGSLVLRAAAIFGLFVLAVWLLPHADARLAVYFPSFALGVYASRDVLHPKSEWMAGPLALVIIFGAATEVIGAFTWLWIAGLAASGALLLFRWGARSSIARRPSAVVAFVSTAAFVMYLSHRPILLLARDAYFPVSPASQLVYLLGVCLPVVVVLSWCVQWAYDATLAILTGGGGARGGGAPEDEVA